MSFNPISQHVIDKVLTNDKDVLRSQLEEYSFIDIGFIQSVDESNRATVLSNRFINGQRVTYTNIEVVSFGNNNGAIDIAGTGSMCLLLVPNTVMKDTLDAVMSNSVPKYSLIGMKAIPITNSTTAKVKFSINEEGSIILSSTRYNMVFNQDSVSIHITDDTNNKDISSITVANDGTFSYRLATGLLNKIMSPDGTNWTIEFDSSGNIYYMEKHTSAGVITIYRHSLAALTASDLDDISAYTKWQWIETYAADGTHTVTENKLNGSDVEAVFSISINAAGACSLSKALSITVTEDVTISSEGNVSIKNTGSGKTMLIQSEGNVTVESTAGTTIVNGHNDVTVHSATGVVTIQGKSGTLKVN